MCSLQNIGEFDNENRAEIIKQQQQQKKKATKIRKNVTDLQQIESDTQTKHFYLIDIIGYNSIQSRHNPVD